MYYNPMANIFLRLLGQAAARSFAEQAQRTGTGSAPPFDESYAAGQSDDEPISVEAQVADDDGKTQNQRAHEKWDAQRDKAAARGLSGDVALAGSKRYNIACGIICVLFLLLGVVLRIYSLVMGQIFSATIVPVALGALGGIVLAFVGGGALWKIGAWKLPFDAADLGVVFISAVCMGYANLPCALVTAAAGAIYMRASGGKKPAFIAFYLVVAVIVKLVFGWPGLAI